LILSKLNGLIRLDTINRRIVTFASSASTNSKRSSIVPTSLPAQVQASCEYIIADLPPRSFLREQGDSEGNDAEWCGSRVTTDLILMR